VHISGIQQELGSRSKRLHNASQKGSRKIVLAAVLDTKSLSAIPAVICLVIVTNDT